MHQRATTFEAHLEILAIESPTALIMEWGRRLEAAVKNLAATLGVSERGWKAQLNALRSDSLVGEQTVSKIRRLKNLRNEVAHTLPKVIPPENAVQFARDVEEIVWLLGRAQDIRSGADFSWVASLSSE